MGEWSGPEPGSGRRVIAARGADPAGDADQHCCDSARHASLFPLTSAGRRWPRDSQIPAMDAAAPMSTVPRAYAIARPGWAAARVAVSVASALYAGEPAEAAGADAEPDATAPPSIEGVVGEQFKQDAEQECAGHVDAERGHRHSGPLRHERGDQVSQTGANGAPTATSPMFAQDRCTGRGRCC